MHVKSATFVKSAVRPEHYPPADRPEIAFAGRSNVGKSSLINCLVNRRRLVKTSNTPGRTQLINFFDVNDALHFVDLPGYGYARVPVRIQRQWRPMIETYLSGRPTLRAVVLILDLRRTPRGEDLELIAWLSGHGLTVLPILTKADKFSRQQQGKQLRGVAESLGRDPESLILFSAKSGQGREAVWQAIDRLVLDPSEPETEGTPP